MSHERETEERRALLRGLLLDTLNDRDRATAEAYAVTPEGRSALEAERQRLALLDNVATHMPANDLAGQTLAAVRNRILPRRKYTWKRRAVEWSVIVVFLGIVGAVLLPTVTPAREAARRASCQNNLKQLGIIFKMYAGETKGGLYPPLGPYDGIWMFDIKSVYPELLADCSILVDPSHPDAASLSKQMHEAQSKNPIDYEAIARIAAKSYTYSGWLFQSDADIAAAKNVLEKGNPKDRDRDIQIGDTTVPRLREGVDRFLLTDSMDPAALNAKSESDVPVMFCAFTPGVNIHVPYGANVLYMDGHVTFVKLGAHFPVTPSVQSLLAPK